MSQVLRYIYYMQEEADEARQNVTGVIIALEDDPKIRIALAMMPNVEFYRYRINFN